MPPHPNGLAFLLVIGLLTHLRRIIHYDCDPCTCAPNHAWVANMRMFFALHGFSEPLSYKGETR